MCARPGGRVKPPEQIVAVLPAVRRSSRRQEAGARGKRAVIRRAGSFRTERTIALLRPESHSSGGQACGNTSALLDRNGSAGLSAGSPAGLGKPQSLNCFHPKPSHAFTVVSTCANVALSITPRRRTSFAVGTLPKPWASKPPGSNPRPACATSKQAPARGRAVRR